MDASSSTDTLTPPLNSRQKRIIGTHGLYPKHLQTGFCPHSQFSLELAIKASKDPKYICKCVVCDDTVSEEEATVKSISSQSIKTDTFGGTVTRRLSYIMGIDEGEEEGIESEKSKVDFLMQEEEDYITGETESMRRAQLYLRQHRIFEFFQFLVAHLLAASPYDPINFLINLLDKCMIYRAGICDPPLLYDKKHISCLFNMMDRMRTGFIDADQYKTGMLTLGIKSFNPRPPMTEDGMVPKNYFVEEAYERLMDLLNDILRRRLKMSKKSKKMPKAPPPSIRGDCATTENLFTK